MTDALKKLATEFSHTIVLAVQNAVLLLQELTGKDQLRVFKTVFDVVDHACVAAQETLPTLSAPAELARRLPERWSSVPELSRMLKLPAHVILRALDARPPNFVESKEAGPYEVRWACSHCEGRLSRDGHSVECRRSIKDPWPCEPNRQLEFRVLRLRCHRCVDVLFCTSGNPLFADGLCNSQSDHECQARCLRCLDHPITQSRSSSVKSPASSPSFSQEPAMMLMPVLALLGRFLPEDARVLASALFLRELAAGDWPNLLANLSEPIELALAGWDAKSELVALNMRQLHESLNSGEHDE